MSSETNIRLKIRQLVERGNFSKTKVAEKVGCSRNHLHSLLDGDSKLYIEFLEKISELYKIPIYSLLGGNESNANVIAEKEGEYTSSNPDYENLVDKTLLGLKEVLLKARQ